jgi:hypothetical protein
MPLLLRNLSINDTFSWILTKNRLIAAVNVKKYPVFARECGQKWHSALFQ